ncbi:MAG: hybrid sensor histidine kinase/response regulator [Bryobacterales bacterium]|nr:hybrid sensor histidine kinase/response regulator [Bryobacterales bacterium]
MLSTPRFTLLRYLLPFGAIVAALLLQWAVSSVFGKGHNFPFPFFYLIAICIVAWRAGYGPGVVACLLTMVGLPYLVNRSVGLAGIDPSRLILMCGVSLLVSKVSESQRRVRKILRDANAELDGRVHTRTQDLAGAVQALEREVTGRTESELKLQSQLERLRLLDQITRAIAERQDLASVFQVVVHTIEDSLPTDFACICHYEPSTETLTVKCLGARSQALATELDLTENSPIAVDQNGLVRCVDGQLLYEPDTSTVGFPFAQRLADGGLRSVVAAPLMSHGNVFGILVAARMEVGAFTSPDCEFLRQLSEHVALAANQMQIYSALQQAYDDIRRTQESVMEQERLRALGQMASGIAHDINNALSPVALYTESLLDREPDLSPRTRQYLETIQRAIEDVAHTVGRLREFYRNPEPQLILAPVALNTLIGQVLDLTRARWSDIPLKEGIVIQVRTGLDESLPLVSGIESEMREALTNLIFNAVDAMPDGGTLTLRTAFDGGRVPAAADRVHVEVIDAGGGRDEETRRRCMEPFFTTKGERGTGLGLAMVYGFAQRHNADLEIESATGQGTTIRLKFPLAPRDADANPCAYAPLRPPCMPILLVDDDPLILKSLRDILEADGHRVTTANGGREGIETFRMALLRNEEFAVVITDLGMPYVDGRQVARAVKELCASTPVILLTGWGKRLVADDDVPPYVDRVLSKPPKLHQLRTTLAELVPSATRRDLSPAGI